MFSIGKESPSKVTKLIDPLRCAELMQWPLFLCRITALLRHITVGVQNTPSLLQHITAVLDIHRAPLAYGIFNRAPPALDQGYPLFGDKLVLLRVINY